MQPLTFRQRITAWHTTIAVGAFLAWRQLRRASPATTALIVFVMLLTFLNLVVVSGLLVGLITGSFAQFRESYSGEVIVTAAQGRDHIERSQELVGFLASNPAITALSPRHGVNVQMLGTLDDLPEKNERANRIGIRLTGIDPLKEEEVTKFSRFVIKGSPLVPGEEGFVLIGANMLREYSSFADANIPGLDLLDGVDIGSRVRVTIASQDGNPVVKDFRVRGIVKTKVDEISTRAFVLDTELKRLLPAHKEEYQEIALRTNPSYAATLVEQIKNFMGSSPARAQTSEEAIPSFLRDIETTMGMLGNAISSIALVVASITVFIVIFINAITRRKFIGILKGIGISGAAIETSYVIQSLAYAITGSIIGAVILFGFLKPFIDANPIDFPFSDGILVATPLGTALRVVIILVTTLVAGYIPAKLIVRKNTLDSILGR